MFNNLNIVHHTMAVKTITVTEEAYDALKRNKQEHESFSKTIIRMTGKRPIMDFFGILSKEEGERLRTAYDAHRQEDVALDAQREKFLYGRGRNASS